MRYQFLIVLMFIISILNADTIILKSGEAINGIVISHSKKYVILQDTTGNTVKILRSDIAEMKIDKIVKSSRNDGIFIKLNAGQYQFKEKGIRDLYIKEKYKDDIFYSGQIGYRTISNYAAVFGFDYIKMNEDTYTFTIIPITFNFFWYIDIFGKDILDPYLGAGVSLYKYYGDVQLEGDQNPGHSSGYSLGAQICGGLKFKYFLFIEGGYNTAIAKKQGDSYSVGSIPLKIGIQIQF